jgi:hypothetical protein
MKSKIYCKLKLQSTTNKTPKFIINVNGINQNYSQEDNFIIVNNFFSIGDHILTIKFINKTPNDTIVDENGTIIEDLAIEVLEFFINDIDFSSNIKEHGKYYVNETNEKTYGFMYANGIFKYKFQTPGFLFLRNINLIK